MFSKQSSFSNLFVTSPTSQLILQPFRCFTYITAHSPILPLLQLRHSSFSNLLSLHLRHNSFSNPSFPTSQLILQSFRCFTYVKAHSPTFSSLHLRHCSLFNPSVALPTSQIILQSFHCFTYVTAHSPILLSLLLRHRLFTYVIWRVAHVQ